MISIKDLNFSYSKKGSLFNQLDLELSQGKIYGLLGKNGTGKSSLLKLITGVLFPSSGKIHIDQVLSSSRNPQILEKVFFLSEDYDLPSILPHQFINVYAPFYSNFDKHQFDRILDEFKMPLDVKINRMSFGQKKKFLIAFGIASNAKYLLLDEPTNGLDIPSKTQFRQVMASGFSDDQLVVISTHQIRDLSNLIESVIIIENGKIIFSKDVFELENKILFQKSYTNEPHPDMIYGEMTTNGYVQLLENKANQPSPIELEVFFNAVLENGEKINQLF